MPKEATTDEKSTTSGKTREDVWRDVFKFKEMEDRAVTARIRKAAGIIPIIPEGTDSLGAETIRRLAEIGIGSRGVENTELLLGALTEKFNQFCKSNRSEFFEEKHEGKRQQDNQLYDRDVAHTVQPTSLYQAAEYVVTAANAFDKIVKEVFPNELSEEQHKRVVGAMLHSDVEKLETDTISSSDMINKSAFNFFLRKDFTKDELFIYGDKSVVTEAILNVFKAMEMSPASLHRLAKDNTQFPAELVKANMVKLSIADITKIGEKLLEIKKSQKSVDQDVKNPEKSESMKQIADILKAKIAIEESRDNTSHSSLNGDLSDREKAVQLIKKVDPEYQTKKEKERAAEEKAKEEVKGDCPPATSCKKSVAIQLVAMVRGLVGAGRC